MKTKILLTSALALTIACPAIADDTLYNDTISESCTADFLGGDGTNAANSFIAQYAPIKYTEDPGYYLLFSNGEINENQTCPIGSWCPGFTNQDFTDSTMGLNTCPTNYTSDSGASAQNQCYQTCSVSCTQPTAPAHSTNVTYGTETASGRTYYGSDCNAIVPTCSINFDCVTGYHKVSGASYPLSDLASVAGVDVSVMQQLFPGKTTVTEDEIKATLTPEVISMVQSDYQEILSSMGITHEQFVQTQILNTLTAIANGRAGMESVLGVSGDKITEDGTYYNYGFSRLDGSEGYKETDFGLTPGSGEWATEFSYGTVKGQALCAINRTTNYYEIGTPDGTEGEYCWCKMTGFTPTGGTLQSLSSAWVFREDASESGCAVNCAAVCATDVSDYVLYRMALFASLGVTASQESTCVANELTITWDSDNGEASTTNMCTYDGDIVLPETTPEKTGYTFKGWKLVTGTK